MGYAKPVAGAVSGCCEIVSRACEGSVAAQSIEVSSLSDSSIVDRRNGLRPHFAPEESNQIKQKEPCQQ